MTNLKILNLFSVGQKTNRGIKDQLRHKNNPRKTPDLQQ